MKQIKLLCTRHQNAGICNSTELYKIIVRIDPKVIFEEMPPDSFPEVYKEKTRSSLESDAINMYLEQNTIDHIPVDSPHPSKKFFNDHRKLHEFIERRSYMYRELIDADSQYVRMYGFKYLNSIYCSNLHRDLDNEINKVISESNDENKIQILKSWDDVNEKRENEMINNIYGYSSKHEFNTGLFLIGGAHRYSIIDKIEISKKNSIADLNWNYSDYENLINN